MLEVLADPTRSQIFEILGRRPLPVGELAKQLPISRPAVSYHLAALQAAGLRLMSRLWQASSGRAYPQLRSAIIGGLLA